MVSKMRLATIALALTVGGCATATIPLVGSIGSGVRQELKIQALQEQIQENNQIIEFLLDLHPELEKDPNDQSDSK